MGLFWLPLRYCRRVARCSSWDMNVQWRRMALAAVRMTKGAVTSVKQFGAVWVVCVQLCFVGFSCSGVCFPSVLCECLLSNGCLGFPECGLVWWSGNWWWKCSYLQLLVPDDCQKFSCSGLQKSYAPAVVSGEIHHVTTCARIQFLY